MKFLRIIPRLDIKGPDLVKGIHLEGLRVLGDPEEYALIYSKQGADEIIYQDTVASLYGRNSILDLVSRTAKSCFIPLTVGGGIRTLKDIQETLRAGADKVSINTAALKEPSFIEDSAKTFGSSTIVIAIEASKYEGKYLAFTDNGREYTGKSVVDWAKEAESRGAGEILLTSIDQEGTGKGFEIELIKQISEKINIPLIVHGGAGKLEHFVEVCETTRVDGFATSSVLHYDLLNANKITKKKTETGNTEYLNRNVSYSSFSFCNIADIKTELDSVQVNVRGKW